MLVQHEVGALSSSPPPKVKPAWLSDVFTPAAPTRLWHPHLVLYRWEWGPQLLSPLSQTGHLLVLLLKAQAV